VLSGGIEKRGLSLGERSGGGDSTPSSSDSQNSSPGARAVASDRDVDARRAESWETFLTGESGARGEEGSSAEEKGRSFVGAGPPDLRERSTGGG